MWGYGNSANIKPIGNYEQAKERFDSTVPIRGRKKECRPLGRNRRYTGYTINKNMRAIDDGVVGQWQETYSAKVYDKDVIEWTPDGVVAVRIGRWHGTIIQSVVNYTLLSAVGTIQSYNGKWYFHNGNGKAYFIPQDKDQELRIVVENGAVENPVQEYRRRVKRKEMNAIRKNFANFIEYGTNMLKLTSSFDYDEKVINQLMGGNEGTRSFTWSRWVDAKSLSDRRTKFLNLVKSFESSGDLTLAYSLVAMMIRSINYWGNSCTSEQFKKSFDEVLKYEFRNEVFESIPVEIGTAFYDRNGKYFY